MLVLSRKRKQKIIIGAHFITILVVDIRGDKVRLGIDAPRELPVHREEVFLAIEKKKKETEDKPERPPDYGPRPNASIQGDY